MHLFQYLFHINRPFPPPPFFPPPAPPPPQWQTKTGCKPSYASNRLRLNQQASRALTPSCCRLQTSKTGSTGQPARRCVAAASCSRTALSIYPHARHRSSSNDLESSIKTFSEEHAAAFKVEPRPFMLQTLAYGAPWHHIIASSPPTPHPHPPPPHHHHPPPLPPPPLLRVLMETRNSSSVLWKSATSTTHFHRR